MLGIQILLSLATRLTDSAARQKVLIPTGENAGNERSAHSEETTEKRKKKRKEKQQQRENQKRKRREKMIAELLTLPSNDPYRCLQFADVSLVYEIPGFTI